MVLATVAGSAAHAATYAVGSTRANPTIASVVALVRPGDVVEIDPGTYREAVRWTGGSLAGGAIVVRGVGARPVIDGTGVSLTGVGPVPRALFQVEGDNFVFENLAFQNADNGQNAAAIRVLNARRTAIRQVFIVACNMGVMSSGNDDLLIERSEFVGNGTPSFNGFSHNLYLEGNRTTIQFSAIHDARYGQNVQFRGHYLELLYNWVADSNEGEIGLVDSAESGVADSNGVFIGNVVVSKAGRTGNTQKFIDFGQDLAGVRNGTLYAFHNTFVAGASTIRFLSLTSPGTAAVLTNNVFFGSDFIVGVTGGGVSGTNNYIPPSATPAAGMTSSIAAASPGFADAAGRNFRPEAASALIDRAVTATSYRDGAGASHAGAPGFEYAAPTSGTPRPSVGPPDIGAFEFVAPGGDGGVADGGGMDGGGGGIGPGPGPIPKEGGTPDPPRSCGCGAAGGAGGVAFLLGAVMARRRRRR